LRMRGQIRIYNADLRLLTYINELLKRLGIKSADPKLQTRRGTILDPRAGKQYMTKKHVYVIYVQARSNVSFYKIHRLRNY
jgi:hypothetical protein